MIADPAARGQEPRNNLNELTVSGHFRRLEAAVLAELAGLAELDRLRAAIKGHARAGGGSGGLLQSLPEGVIRQAEQDETLVLPSWHTLLSMLRELLDLPLGPAHLAGQRLAA
jgi:hypothetical protein